MYNFSMIFFLFRIKNFLEILFGGIIFSTFARLGSCVILQKMLQTILSGFSPPGAKKPYHICGSIPVYVDVAVALTNLLFCKTMHS